MMQTAYHPRLEGVDPLGANDCGGGCPSAAICANVAATAVRRTPMNDQPTLSQRADALEEKMSRELDYIVIKSRLYSMAEGDMSPPPNAAALMAANPHARVLMGDDPRLPSMPEKPTLMDFFKYRFGPAAHLLQSARHAVKG